MSYAYGMRFDDDSNAITVIDEDNQTANTTGYINGEYVEFGGRNPNYKQVITSTAKDVFSPDSLRRLSQAIVSENASATLEMNMNGEVITRPLIASVSEAGLHILQFQHASISIADVKRIVAINAQWQSFNDSTVVQQRIYFASGQNGEYTVTDYTSYAVGINVTLTIIWHPLPEE